MEKIGTYHTLKVPEIINELDKHNISAERKSIYEDIKSLKTFGMISYAEIQRLTIT
jgi:hypothetical protein